MGFGNGEHLLGSALAAPHRDYIGAEVYAPGVGHALLRLEEQPLPNVRIYYGDVRDLLQAIPIESLSLVVILFPDPWHKRRHRKRRLLQPGLISDMARCLVPAGVLYVATDCDDYAEAIARNMEAQSCLRKSTRSAYDTGRLPTPFEERGINSGRAIRELVYEKAPA